ncbi:Bromodomain transcription factor, putative isoform 1 [Hibiscus syriacus]|uniref:Bromodomain transcription factor, putative isoform 1 n=1 Tax=Hibiscus syriacus TaxID=106335 RepID=A0A6A3AR85_HIBSY|nr:Bromodomain transcription factor, putative isoform 1 [Hibiscus syriacus]
MSAKFVCSLSDENPDLQKQIGCMNGLFHLFDRHHFFAGRRIHSPDPKRLPPPGQNSKQGAKPKIASEKMQEVKENNMKKTVKDKQRFSFESPRTSFSSSSCSSSFSSADCSKASQIDRSSMSQTAFPKTARPEISNCQSRLHSVDLRDVVKDSIYREVYGLSIKAATKVGAGQHQTYAHMDSPRPLQSPKPAKTRNINLNEPSPVLHKLEDAPAVSYKCTPSDARRFSYDERGSQDALKTKLQDLPRLSLDSRESSIKGSMNGKKSNFILEEQQKSSQQKEPGGHHGQSSIVAKLMGLEAFPSPMLTNGNQTRPINTSQDLKDDPLSYSSRIYEHKKNWISGSPRSSKTEPNSPHLTNTSSKKPAASKRPIEPAPWKQQDGTSKGQTSVSKCRETGMKATNSSLTVFGEIEKRLAELEFKKSGKDLRALKQILEAMQKHKQLLVTRGGGQGSNFVSHTNSIIGGSSEAPNLRKLQSSNAISATVKGISSPTRLRSPSFVVNPDKIMENASNCTSLVHRLRKLRSISPADNRTVDKRSYKDLTPRPNYPREPSSRLHLIDKGTARTPKFNQTSKEPFPTAQENPKLAMSSETACLKLQKKRLELERQSHCASPASGRGRSRRQSSRLQSEPGFPPRKPRHKSHNLQRSDDQLSDIGSDMRDSSQQGDASSMRSESNMSSTSYGGIEVTSADRSQKHENRQNNTTARSSKDETPSPLKKRTNLFKDDEGLIPDEADWSPTSLGFTTDYRKEENIQHLVQKVVNLGYIHEWSIINEIAPVCNSPNADHKYIVEVLLASGLFDEPDSCFMAYCHHPLDHLINPNLFASLEKTKASIRLVQGKHNGRKVKQSELIEKNHRKLMFDAVNEILLRKFVKEDSYKQWHLPADDRRPRRQQLVRDLCSEINKIQTAPNISLDDDDDALKNILWGELTLGSMEWTECISEIPCVVLDVERLIFKDLICEVISGEAANPRVHPGGHCRRLLLK